MRKIPALFLLAMLVTACAGTASLDLTSFKLPVDVEVTFNTLLPDNSPSGELVQFTILDEITGLEYNRQAFDLNPNGENSASITLSVPPGTLLKYRYARVSAAGTVDELNADGNSISYRTYLVDGPGHVAYDMVAAWADLPTTQATGQVSGVLADATSGQPLANLMVVAAGLQTRSDGEGRFLLAGLPQGLHNVLVFAPSGSHLPFQQGALVAAGSETPANIQLQPSATALVTFWLTPPEEHTSSTPVFLIGNTGVLDTRPLLSLQADGRYTATVTLPVGVDIRYKYSLGDGLWNAEHLTEGDYSVRQFIIPHGTTAIEIEDQVASWQAGSSAPIWFDLTAPADGLLAYIQFNLGDWGTPLPLWPLGAGHWAYKLYSPTNFAVPLEYRYCLDAACTRLEEFPGAVRTVSGNATTLQQMQDKIDAWKSQ